MEREKRKKKKSEQHFIVTLVKNREFIIVRFCRHDYCALSKKLIREVYIKPYLNEGWKLLDIEDYCSQRWYEVVGNEPKKKRLQTNPVE